MKSNLRLGMYSLGYQAERMLGISRMLPLNLTVSVTFACNSKCKTCNIWKKSPENELSVDEYGKIFSSLKTVPAWFTMSGGEPFLRKDLPEICALANKCRPKIINIPTNGLLPQRIEEGTRQILEACPKTEVVVNLSLDGLGKKHDEIRGVPGNFDKAVDTFHRLKALKQEHPNFVLGVHTVLSKLSIPNLEALVDYVSTELKPDSYITEIAEERVELDTVGFGLTPGPDEYMQAIQITKKFTPPEGLPRLIQKLRRRYYKLTEQTLREQRQILPCYAGLASAQIDPVGNVWPCCMNAISIGNLREAGYDFGKVWSSEKAKAARKAIRQKKCHCTLANANYTNMLCNPRVLVRCL